MSSFFLELSQKILLISECSIKIKAIKKNSSENINLSYKSSARWPEKINAFHVKTDKRLLSIYISELVLEFWLFWITVNLSDYVKRNHQVVCSPISRKYF